MLGWSIYRGALSHHERRLIGYGLSFLEGRDDKEDA